MIYPEENRDNREQKSVKAQNIKRLASLERSKGDVMDEIIRDAQKRDPEHKRQWVVLLDEALHLWDLVDQHLKGVGYVGILDIIHIVEYLYIIGNALYRKNEAVKLKKWVYKMLVDILEGRVVSMTDKWCRGNITSSIRLY
ncbi:MAG: hypothetical protein CSA25_02410 [Desulfobacter postgatei]|uniref:Uncharacterized protein n=1 Tax=Desulfobacter postgatei TaxID=2293 RepID=A0A2G6MTR1_9BACT|nr:MAG: hypothetical protein CSA25_02410 [Desulfobacter postgatei]